ncbi:hypothetical protein EI555_013845, partial [Monodon monoceros]
IGKLIDMGQPFGLSKSQYGMEHAPFDGILGLGYPSLATQGTTPIFDTLKRRSLIPQPVFAFYLSSITMNGVVFGCFRGCQAILDTGTSLVLGPSRLVTAIQMLISASPVGHEYAVSCSYVARLPTIIFSINGNDYPLPPQAYIRK